MHTIVRHVRKVVKFITQKSAISVRYILRVTPIFGKKIGAFLYTNSIKLSLFAHHHFAVRPHLHLTNKYARYRRWHQWKKHRHVHAGVLGTYVFFVGFAVLGSYTSTQALSDLVDTWDFGDAGDFSIDSGLEIISNIVRHKPQNYANDGNTRALYHMDELSGTNIADSSSNSNTATGTNTSFVTGNLNNALSLNGTTANASAADSSSLSLSQANTLEAWTKFNSSFSAGSHDHRQGVLDKGPYKLYYDQETGKATYELENATATTWSQKAGNDIGGSWDLNGKMNIVSQVVIGSDMYAGLGNAVGDAEVWKWNGTSWSQVGGDGKNDSWADQTFENVTSLSANGTILYAGLGSGTGDAEVWSCDTSTGCTDWTKIGGDGINSGWAVNTYEEVTSMTFMSGNLYAGLGTTANDAEVWRWNGSSWTKIGGDSLNSGWTTNIESVYSLTNDGTNVYAGTGLTAGDGDVWRWNGSSWAQIGGDGVNSSWAASTFEYVYSLQYFGGNLYAGIGATAGDAEVWRWNGSSWTKIGGDTVNSSWDSSSYEMVYSMANDGTNLYAGLGNTAGDNEVYRWNGSSWTKIGGDGVNSGFTNTHTIVQSLAYGSSTLYAGLSGTGSNGEMWSWNGSAWTRMGGGYINNSWGYFNLQNVESMTVYGEYLYAGTGNTVAGNAQVWRYDGTTWQIVGGQGINSSWAAGTYEDVMSMVSFGGNLYVGLGTTANDAEVWRYNGSTWTQVGGDSLNSGWTTGFEEVYSLANFGGNLYAGIGNSANDAEVWRYNGSTWTKIGGDSLNSGWTTNYERVSSLSIYNGELYAGLGVTATEAEVWKWNGSAWSKIGGDGASSSWNTNYEQIESMQPYNGKLYVGLGNTTADAEIWEYDGSTWTKVGGDDVNSSWVDGQYEVIKSMTVYNGKLYAGLGNTTGDGEVWEYNNGSWTKVGGSLVNSSWAANTMEMVRSFSVYKGKLYAGLGDTANADASVWAYGNNGFLQSSTATQDTNWHHLAATYDGTTMRLYIDGVQDSQTAASLSLPDTTQPLLIGSTYGSSEAGFGQSYFNGTLDEVRISDIARSSFNAQPYSSTSQIVTLDEAVRKSGVWHWDTFTTSETLNGGSINYRLSDDDGATWKYWNGSAWVTSSGTSQANSQAVISANISTFPVTFDGIKWQAILLGNGSQQVSLNSVEIEATSDVVTPSANASAITAKKANGGSALAQNDWTNGSSPYFDWTAGTDDESGVKGYCLYLGTDNTANPVTTKGILGASPVATGGNCQFLVTSLNVDLATSGYIATQMTTSNTPYYLRIKAIDRAGNLTTNSAQFAIRFDNTPPTNPAFITAPSGFVNSKDVTLTWPTSGGSAPDDSNSGLAGLQYKIGNTTWYGDGHTGSGDNTDLLTNDGSYTTQNPPDYDNLIDGINTVYFRTWDEAGNVNASPVTAAIKLNTSGAPSEPQSLVASPTSNTTNSFAFSWATPATYIGNANQITYCYTINTLPSASSCTYTSAGITSLGAGPYATQPGANTFYVVARDESSNVNYANYASTTFTANTPSPGIPLNVDIVDVSIKSTNNWRLALTWDAPSYVGSGISSYKVYRSTDNSVFSFVGSSSSTTYIDAGLSQLRYYYKVKACDSTNNCGAESTSVDELPTGKFTSAASIVAEPTVTDITTKKARISWSTDRASDSKIAIGTSSGNYSSSEISSSSQTTSHQIDIDNLSAGTTYYYVAKWTDEDGNTGVSQEYSFKTSPAPSLKEVSDIKVALSSATIQFISKEAYKVDIIYGASEAFGGIASINTSPNESTYTSSLDGLQDGTKYFYKLITYDKENNKYESSVYSFTTPARPKISNLRFQPISGEPTSTQQVSWTTNVPSNSMVTYGRENGGSTDTQTSELTTEHSIIIKDLIDDSEYYLIAQSRDASGNLATSDKQTFKTALDTRPPKVSNVTVETSIRGTGAEARGQAVVSWTTDEPSTSQVAYAEGSGATSFNNKTAEDSTLSTEHIVIVSDLPTSRVYSVQPVSRDRSNNAGVGEAQSAIVGRASDDVLTIVFNILRRVFGY